MLAAKSNNRGVQAHIASNTQESTIAAFLIGAYCCRDGRPCGSYLGVGGWSDNGDRSPAEHWLPAFGWPLGEPKSDATYDHIKATWTRSFTHVNVTFDAMTKKGQIEGWNFSESN